ncbi:pilus assembly protein PilP [Pasteurellaceae bacterium LIM206]|nr:pilus assembly protein PilP [Pasteurellaceae bacterium LIM206]
MRLFILSLFVLCHVSALAKDPFEPPERQQAEDMSAMAAKHFSGCADKAVNVAADLSFNQLKIAGMMKSQRQHLLFLADSEPQIYVVEIGDVVGKDQWELAAILPNELHFVQWQADCRTSTPMKVKF